jgi:spore germination cell wall hydrolase CwlJ-like protein
MEYEKNLHYLRSASADQITEAAVSGKPRSGLGSRAIDREPLEVEEPDLQNKYMGFIKGMRPEKTEVEDLADLGPTEEEMAETSDEVTSMVRPEAKPGTPIAAGIDERELLAKTLQAEAGNQDYEGILAVGSVIANRVKSGNYGKGLRGVILKPGQFSAWNSETGYAGGEQGQNMERVKPSAAAYKAADAIISGEYESSVGDATHYYNNSISVPKWGKEKAGGNWSRIGDHIFGKADG